MILIITPVYRAYDRVVELCQAIDTLTKNPFLHILVDDDSNQNLPFPVKASANRRIMMLKRDYPGMVHKNGGGQAIQIGYEWAHHMYIGEKGNAIPYDQIFLIESDVIPLDQDWDQKMIDLVSTLPEDWLTLDLQSVEPEDITKLTYPTTVSPRLGMEREDLEIMKYPDFQVTLFNQKVFDQGVKFSDFASHFDVNFGSATAEKVGGRHFRTTTLHAKHYFYQSRQYLNEIPVEWTE